MRCQNKIRIPINRNNNEKDQLKIFTGRQNYITVDCGHCEACRRNKVMALKELMEKEIEFWKYGITLTLTYNSKNIPVIKRIPDNYLKELRARDEDKDELITTKQRATQIAKEYGTLKYYHAKKFIKDIRKKIEKTKSLNTIKKNSIEEYKKIVDFKYFGCGEYPEDKKVGEQIIKRGRPHIHIIFLFNDLRILKPILRGWRYGQIGVNRVNEEYDLIEIKRQGKNNSTKLNLIIEQNENREKDIERIYKYYEEKRTTTKLNTWTIGYVAKYTVKNYKNIDIAKESFKIVDRFTSKEKENEYINFIAKKRFLSDIRRLQVKIRNSNEAREDKEPSFIFKSQKLGYKWVEKNIEHIINYPYEYKKKKDINGETGKTKRVLLNKKLIQISLKFLDKRNRNKDFHNLQKLVRKDIYYRFKKETIELKEKYDIDIEIIKHNNLTFDFEDRTPIDDNHKHDYYTILRQKAIFINKEQEKKDELFNKKRLFDLEEDDNLTEREIKQLAREQELIREAQIRKESQEKINWILNNDNQIKYYKSLKYTRGYVNPT